MEKNKELFERLFLEKEKNLIKFFISYVGDVKMAEEIVQETYIKALNNFHKLRKISSFSSWIHKIGINLAKNYIKQRKQLPLDELPKNVVDKILSIEVEDTPENICAARESEFICLHSVTECLNVNERIIFCLSASIEMPKKTIAKVLECSEENVRITLHRAKKKFANFLKGRCGLINPHNPCKCIKIAQFSIDNNLMSKPDYIEKVEDENLHNQLLDAYSMVHLYKRNLDLKETTLVKKVQEKIKNREWIIFSSYADKRIYFNLNAFKKNLLSQNYKNSQSYYNSLYSFKKKYFNLNKENIKMHLESMNFKKQEKFIQSLLLFFEFNNIESEYFL